MTQKQCGSCHWWLRDTSVSTARWGTCMCGQQHLAQAYIEGDAGMREDDGSDCAMWKQVGQDNAEDY